MVADDLVPGDRPVEPRRLEGLLVVDGAGPYVGAGTGRDDLAVNDVDIPPQFVVLGIVAGIAE